MDDSESIESHNEIMITLPNNMNDVTLDSKPDVSIQEKASFHVFFEEREKLIKSWQQDTQRELIIKEYID